MRLVGYVCVKCEEKDDELFYDSEEKPEILPRKCKKCGGDLKKSDRKDNGHRWNFMDRGGI